MTRRILIGITALGLIVFIGANVLAYQHAYAMLYFSDQSTATSKPEKLSWTQKIGVLLTGIHIPRPVANHVPTVVDDSCKSITIPNGEDATLGAWHCHSHLNKGLVILFHGYVGNKSSMAEEAKAFLQENYSVLLVDFRGSWESSESYTSIGYWEANDVASAIEYANAHYQPEKIVLYGQSMGAAAIFRAVHSLNASADAIIAEAIFDNLLNTVKNRFSIMGVPAFPGAQLLVFWGGLHVGFNGFSHNPVDYAKAINFPILFLHGEQDNRVSPLEARKVYEAVPAAKTFSIFPNTAHESHLAKFPEKWKIDVMDFLNKHLHGGAQLDN